MKATVVRWLVNTLALLFTAKLIKGIYVDGVIAALLAAALLGVINAFIRPLVIVLTLPVNIITLGLFTFVINGLMLQLVSAVSYGFRVDGMLAAIVGSLVLSLVSGFLSLVVVDRGR
ncbi:MAG TPA: phage holin family protein [Firmicutes bacterium]|jgi:putative membrane protein|nr:phage holin family protein [Bacillota bacterium]